MRVTGKEHFVLSQSWVLAVLAGSAPPAHEGL